MEMKIGGVGIDCADLDGMTAFWSGALAYEVARRDGAYAALKDPAGRGPVLFMQKVPEPKIGKNRLHIDLYTTEMEGEAARLIDLGAGHKKDFDGWIVLTDPEGNEFCVCKAEPGEM
ncbi:MAG: VOC family protein [Actinomycetota bacterium]|nr:VOC family protein [Actinomycetota bacterium]